MFGTLVRCSIPMWILPWSSVLGLLSGLGWPPVVMALSCVSWSQCFLGARSWVSGVQMSNGGASSSDGWYYSQPCGSVPCLWSLHTCGDKGMACLVLLMAQNRLVAIESSRAGKGKEKVKGLWASEYQSMLDLSVCLFQGLGNSRYLMYWIERWSANSTPYFPNVGLVVGCLVLPGVDSYPTASHCVIALMTWCISVCSYSWSIFYHRPCAGCSYSFLDPFRHWTQASSSPRHLSPVMGRDHSVCVTNPYFGCTLDLFFF